MSVKSLNVHVDSVTSHPRTYSPQLQVVTSVSQRLDSVSIVSQVVSQSSSAIGFGSSLSEKTSLFSCGTSGSGLRFFDLATLNITQLSGRSILVSSTKGTSAIPGCRRSFVWAWFWVVGRFGRVGRRLRDVVRLVVKLGRVASLSSESGWSNRGSFGSSLALSESVSSRECIVSLREVRAWVSGKSSVRSSFVLIASACCPLSRSSSSTSSVRIVSSTSSSSSLVSFRSVTFVVWSAESVVVSCCVLSMYGPTNWSRRSSSSVSCSWYASAYRPRSCPSVQSTRPVGTSYGAAVCRRRSLNAL
uniref:(northern house mosquito) hypothetical protein n=1 Tax=Culex pipiens TaxID=7175 RepID=A0A8D8MRK6_CULPI